MIHLFAGSGTNPERQIQILFKNMPRFIKNLEPKIESVVLQKDFPKVKMRDYTKPHDD